MNKDKYTQQELMLEVGDGHRLYVMDWGNPDAKTPIICLHGGPGGGSSEYHKAPYDPERQRVVFFDQRGSGKSTPLGSRDHNTTEDLSEDIVKVTERLGIARYYLEGYSWGSTLALYHTIAHPERVAGLFVGGIFLGGQPDEDFVHGVAPQYFFPELWQEVLEATPAENVADPIAYHVGKALNGSEVERKKSIYVLDSLESGMMRLGGRGVPENYEEYDPTSAGIEIFYIANHCFMPENYLLDNAHKIKCPVYIVQGRYDCVCAPAAAWRLHKALPDSRLYWTVSNHVPEHEITSIMKALLDEIVV